MDSTLLEPEFNHRALHDPERLTLWTIECGMSKQCPSMNIQLHAGIAQSLDDRASRLPAHLNYETLDIGCTHHQAILPYRAAPNTSPAFEGRLGRMAASKDTWLFLLTSHS
ncbi:hypothetical protein [Arthrobacter sp. B0490]|uniref:hypothetical protein n=1 Tax=Arthrobacter sp. B0490 TaxID=2058891 RepID=UPI0011B00FED|nr:hypothetical protein [Arthrobacter sp. B0490]